ncbi:hypothetical protein [Humidesulfovibrio idahonensis]
MSRTSCLTSLLLAGALVSALGCATGREQAANLGQAAGFQPMRIETAPFVLRGWLRESRRGLSEHPELAVYIEGDGLAWIRPNRPSSDPTPTDPIGLRLAAVDPSGNPVLYLGRPCQYTEGADRRGCSTEDWTSARFSPRAVEALNAAIDQAKAATGSATVALFGYSGGGALAALLAERRSDVRFLGTVAGNLDPGLWTTLFGDTPLHGSLNPVDAAQATRDIPQLHVTGGRDDVVPGAVLDSWCQRLPDARIMRVVVPGAWHGGPWVEVWPGLLIQSRKIAPSLKDD